MFFSPVVGVKLDLEAWAEKFKVLASNRTERDQLGTRRVGGTEFPSGSNVGSLCFVDNQAEVEKHLESPDIVVALQQGSLY